jgi:hypothetical protein
VHMIARETHVNKRELYVLTYIISKTEARNRHTIGC